MDLIKKTMVVDSYIEELFQLKCCESVNGTTLFGAWLNLKNEYCGITKTVIYEFMNYSMHDSTHSVVILQNIELLIGRERLNLLSKSELFVLLNVAYAHDIGMAITYEELIQLWEDNEFIGFIERMKTNPDVDSEVKRMCDLYEKIDAFLLGYPTSSDEEEVDSDEKYSADCYYRHWPVWLRQGVSSLVGEYLRTKHAKRSKQYFEKKCFVEHAVIPNRIFSLIGDISALHGEAFKEIKRRVKKKCVFGIDDIHPCFLAILLRLADLLDLDNNRFDYYNLRYIGILPTTSMQHYLKHKAVTHLNITNEIVEVEARSDSIEVCNLMREWMDMIKDEVQNLMLHWAEFAPTDLGGCIMQEPDLKVFHSGLLFDFSATQSFTTDTKKTLELFTGDKLYDSKMDFIREYIQNALDASKIQMWYEIKHDIESKHNNALLNTNVDLDEIKPFDIKAAVYNSFTITVCLSKCEDDENKFVLEISDTGIGIAQDDLDSIIKIGKGWRGRKKYDKDIHRMRKWLRPTGGFGIGLQAAFMKTEKVKIYTKSQYNQALIITLNHNSNFKNVFIETDDENIDRGTVVQFELDIESCIEELIVKYDTCDFTDLANKDYFNIDTKLELLKALIKAYIDETIPNSIFPIEVRILGESKGEMCHNAYLFEENKTVAFEQLKTDEKNRFYISSSKTLNQIKLWDDINETLSVFTYKNADENKERQIHVYYKNVIVKSMVVNNLRVEIDTWIKAKENQTRYPLLDHFDVMVDIMGKSVGVCLTVSRSCFRSDLDSIKLKEYFNSMINYVLMLDISELRKYLNRSLITLLIFHHDFENIDFTKLLRLSDDELQLVLYDFYEYDELNNHDGYVFKKKVYNLKELYKKKTQCIFAFSNNTDEDTLGTTFIWKNTSACPAMMALEEMDKETIIKKTLMCFSNDAFNQEVSNVSAFKNVYAEFKAYMMSEANTAGDSSVPKAVLSEIVYVGEDIVSRYTTSSMTNADEPQFSSLYTVHTYEPNEREYIHIKSLHQKFALDYPELLVKRVPFESDDIDVAKIIVPFTYSMTMKLNSLKLDNEEKMKKIKTGFSKKDRYEKILQESNTFTSLLKYVYLNQLNKRKYKIHEIKTAYLKFVAEYVEETRTSE